MLTQEDFVASNMSGEASLHRSSWKAEAIRRGDLKISGPIPITEDMPLNEEEEQEYAEKHKSETSPLPQESKAEEAQLEPQAPTHAPPPVPEESHQDVDREVEHVHERPQTSDEQCSTQPTKMGSPPRDTSETHRRTITEPLPYSTPSPYPNRPDSSVRTTPRKKRKSGLRNVFRKMFGKRSKDEETDGAPETVPRGHIHTASVRPVKLDSRDTN
jgi:hypothetical protein